MPPREVGWEHIFKSRGQTLFWGVTSQGGAFLVNPVIIFFSFCNGLFTSCQILFCIIILMIYCRFCMFVLCHWMFKRGWTSKPIYRISRNNHYQLISLQNFFVTLFLQGIILLLLNFPMHCFSDQLQIFVFCILILWLSCREWVKP